MNKPSLDFTTLLREAALKATPGRIALLELLSKESKPLAVHQIEERMKGALNHVTLYRALEALEKAQLVTRINLEHEHAHFELAVGRPHHHHAVCSECGLIEDIEIPHSKTPEIDAVNQTKAFARIDRYSLEFFGLCKKCA